MIVWVKYGFESQPLKMYNTNVSSAILLSFLRATCIKDLDEFCKQKTIQLSIELDALRRTAVGRKSSISGNVVPSDSVAQSATTPQPGSRPPSGGGSAGSGVQRPTTPLTPSTTRRGSNAAAMENLSEEEIAMRTKKTALEKQLETINAAAKLVKELISGTAWVDLVDQSGARLHLDEAGNARVNALLKVRQEYAAAAVTKTEYGDLKVTPLVFKLGSNMT